MNTTEMHSWPGWETTRLIGRGSFGAVYEIQRKLFEDEEEVEKAALKVISIPQNDSDIEEMYSDGYDEESVTSAFHTHLKSIVTEYSLMRKMNGSANIVNCDDVRYVQHEDGIGWDIFIKMELLTPLTKALPAMVSEEQVIKIAKDMCAALELCNKHNIVHRDIKPQNIFVSKNGDYKLGDFGIAKTVEKTMGGTKTGTYKYMAPEVYSNRPYNSTADIYSLGLVLYWLLNERRMPFMPLPPEKLRAGMDEESRNRRFSGEKIPAPKNGSEKLKRIVLKACAFDPKDRYQSAREMMVGLMCLSGGSVQKQRREYVPVCDSYDAMNDQTIGPAFNSKTVDDTDDFTKTVGPQFTPQNKDNVDDLGKTVGPIFTVKKKAKLKPWGAISVVLCAILLVTVGLLASRGNRSTETLIQTPPTVATPPQKSELIQTPPTVATPPQKSDSSNMDSTAIGSTLDLSGNFALGTWHESYVLSHSFIAIVDTNHHMYLYDEGSNCIYDTGINNVVNVATCFAYSGNESFPRLFYLSDDGTIWEATLAYESRWSVLGTERYGTWENVKAIYTNYYENDLAILCNNGDLYIENQKVPVSNVVNLQGIDGSIMFRTADGAFYAVGKNCYGSFVSTSAKWIPDTQPERLLIDQNVDDACVVRSGDKFRIAILADEILSVQDAPNHLLIPVFEGVRMIDANDCALYLIDNYGTLYGYGRYSSNVRLTDAGSADDGFCKINEFSDMNTIVGLGLNGWGCIAVDRDGLVKMRHQVGHQAPTEYLYKENGVQFNFTNGKPWGF